MLNSSNVSKVGVYILYLGTSSFKDLSVLSNFTMYPQQQGRHPAQRRAVRALTVTLGGRLSSLHCHLSEVR